MTCFMLTRAWTEFAVICYKWMQYTDKNLTYIQNNENCENHEFLRNKRNIFYICENS